MQRAIAQADLAERDINAVAVTLAPGLVGALLVGVSFAKAFAFRLGRPLVAVHHLEGHLFAATLEHPAAVPPFTALLVSGGHTLLLNVAAWGDYRLLGGARQATAKRSTRSPSSSACHIPEDATSKPWLGAAIPDAFTRPMLRGGQRLGDADYFDLSFSGIKTAVLHAMPDP